MTNEAPPYLGGAEHAPLVWQPVYDRRKWVEAAVCPTCRLGWLRRRDGAQGLLGTTYGRVDGDGNFTAIGPAPMP